jgi:hypothetical protein
MNPGSWLDSLPGFSLSPTHVKTQGANDMTSPAKKRNLYDLFETDKNLETNGVAFQFGDSKFLCKRAGGSNKQFDATFEDRTRAFSTKMQMASLSDDQSEAILKDVYFDAVVLSWEDVTDRDGNDLPFTKENFIQVMTDLPDLWKNLRQAAANMDNFLRKQKSAAAEKLGNS